MVRQLKPIVFSSLVAGVIALTGCDQNTAPSSPSQKSAESNLVARAAASAAKRKREVYRATFEGAEGVTQTGRKQWFADEKMPVATFGTYLLSVTAVSSGTNAERAKHYIGFASYDVDDKDISVYHVAKYPGAKDTTLAADLKPGDTRIALTDATGWNNDGSEHKRALAWYPYVDSSQTTMENYTYTRHVAIDLWGAGAISSNVVTLLKPWSGPSLGAGTAVRNAESGGTYNYAVIGGAAVPVVATNYSVRIGGGEWENGEHSDIRFRPGTAYIRPVVLVDWMHDGSETGGTLTITNFTIEKVE